MGQPGPVPEILTFFSETPGSTPSPQLQAWHLKRCVNE